MQVHFWAAVDARDALIGADTEAARRSLTWLANHQEPKDMPAEWQPRLSPMRQAAREAAEAGTVEALSMGIARVAARCGECHLQTGAEIAPSEEIDQGLAPEGPELMEDRMGRHAWSVDELWAGLVFPSDQAWQRGVTVLQQMPEEPPREGREPVSADIAAQFEAIRALGERAAEAVTVDARVDVVAKVLLSCEGCHGGL